MAIETVENRINNAPTNLITNRDGSEISTRAETLGDKFRHFVVDLGKHLFTNGLSQREKAAFFENIEKIKKGERIEVSSLLDTMLADHEITFLGVENVGDIKPGIIAQTHCNDGPYDGFWDIFATSYMGKRLYDQEITWIQGGGKDKFHPIIEFFGLHRMVDNRLVGPIHEGISGASDSIYVGGKNPTAVRKIYSKLANGEVVGICPEGRPTKQLVQGDPRAGVIMMAAAKRELPILTVSSFVEDGELIINMSNLPPCSILEAPDGQTAIDVVMRKIAAGMPPEKRGYYSYVRD